MNNYIRQLREDAQNMFPGAVAVEIFINRYGVSVKPLYRGELVDSSMQTINGEWCSQREETP